MSTPTRVLRLLLNRHSGLTERAGLDEQLRLLGERAGCELHTRHIESGEPITEIAKQFADNSCHAVVAGGGDGTLNAVAQALAGTDTAMGILPVGTWNHFARDLGIPLEPELAAHWLAEGVRRRVDVGEVNGRVFLNNAVLGWYPIYRFIKDERKRSGRHPWRAAAWAIWTLLRRNPYFVVRLEAEGRQITRRTPYVLVANNRHQMEGYQLGTRHSLAAGELWVYVLRRQNRWGILRLFLSVVFGLFRAQDEFDVFSARELRVTMGKRARRIGVSLDGEIVVMEQPLAFRSWARSLVVLVPPSAELATAPDEKPALEAALVPPSA